MSRITTLFRGRSGTPWVATALLLLAARCGTTSIATLLEDPGRYEGETVRIEGEVREAAGVLGYGAYRVDDGTGTIPVISRGGGAPRVGTRVGVEETFRSAFTFGNTTAAVLLEEKRVEP